MSSIATTSSAAKYRPGVFRFKTAFIIVALSFVICLLIALDLIHQNAVNVPFMDEWDFLEWTSGDFPITWSWLWLPHNEHRMPLMRLLTIGILRASGHDFRVGCYVVLAILATISLLLLLLIRRIRGHFVWTDAVFPLVLLHLGHCENLLWSFQLQFAASALAPCVLLMLVLTDPNSRWQVPATLIAFAVSLCGFGAAALAYAPFFALWLGVLGWQRIRGSDLPGRRIGLGLIGLSIGLLIATGWYVSSTPRLQNYPAPPSLEAALGASLRFLTLSLGPWVGAAWPYTGWLVLSTTVAVLAGLLFKFWRHPGERYRSAGLLLCWGGLLALAAGIGWGRGAYGNFFVARYATLAVPVVYLTYFSVQLNTLGRWKSVCSAMLCLVMLVSDVPNFFYGWGFAGLKTDYLKKFESDLSVGMRAALLAARHTRSANPSAALSTHFSHPTETLVADRTLKFRQRHIGPFRPAPLDQNSQYVTLNPQPRSDANFQWDPLAHRAHITQAPATLKFSFPEPIYVQRLYLTVYLDRAAASQVPVSISLEQSQISPESRKSWVNLQVPVNENPAYVSANVDDMITGVNITIGSAPAEFRVTSLSMVTGRPPQREE